MEGEGCVSFVQTGTGIGKEIGQMGVLGAVDFEDCEQVAQDIDLAFLAD